MSGNKHFFCIGDMFLSISFAPNQNNGMHLIASFEPFRVSDSCSSLLTEIIIDDTLLPIDKQQRERIQAFETGNGDIVVDKLNAGGYQFIIKDLRGAECCLLIANQNFSICHCALNGNYDMRCFGLNNALMIAYAYASSFHNTLLIHSSLVRHNGVGYAFNAKSGTGKSTQVSMWLKHIPNCDLMNDDNPIIRIIDGQAVVYGSPWSGKTPCYRNIKAPLGAITRIDRAPSNSIERLDTIDAVASLLPSCASMKWDGELYNNLIETLKLLIETTNIYILHCLPNKESALLCKQVITNPTLHIN